MWTYWRTHFETHAGRPHPGAPTDIDRMPAAWREPLCASLARFQLGESGEGRIAREIQRSRIPGIDADYHVALALFVKEEGRHARILAGMVRGLGGVLLRHHLAQAGHDARLARQARTHAPRRAPVSRTRVPTSGHLQ